MVPTVDRGLRDVDFWSIDTAGDRPSMKSTSGLSICPRNCRAYAESDSTYRRWPSAKIVSKARLDFPDPDRPVKTIRLSRGRSTETSFRLCSRAPRTIRRSDTSSLSAVLEGYPGGSLTCSVMLTSPTDKNFRRRNRRLLRGALSKVYSMNEAVRCRLRAPRYP